MTTLIEDPLIARMTVSRPLPLHASSRRLRELVPDSPRTYGIVVMADVGRRRWWPLASALNTDRLAVMFDAAATDTNNPVAAASQLAATLAHAVVGRVAALVMLEARAWDPGLENIWVHVDADGAIDWAGVVDPTLRILPDDPADGPGVVRLPSEAALVTWTAHRCHRALQPLFDELEQVSRGAVSTPAIWHNVGSALVATAAHVPALADSCPVAGMRRGQAMLDALAGFGLPVRGLA